MTDSTFQVVFAGELVPGADPARVKAAVAKVFNSDVAKVEPLFSGRRTVIKRGLDEATARKYRTVFERAGAVVSIVDASGAGQAAPARPAPAPTAPAPATATATATESDPEPDAGQGGPSRTELAEAGRAPPPLVARGVPSAPESMTMADAGALLVDEPSAVAAPAIDTDHLTLSPPGVDLVEHEEVAAREFDLSGLELAPPGTALGDTDSAPRG